jgi:Tol biopolymer transport system component
MTTRTIKLLVMKKADLLILFLVMLVSCNCNSQQHTPEKFINTEIVRPMANNESNLGVGETLDFDLVFYRNDSIFYYDCQTKKINFIIEGSQPCLSNDGRKIAFSITQTDTLTQKLKRGIFIIDLYSKHVHPLNINDKIHLNPAWSPNSEFLIFNVNHYSEMEIGIINAGNTNFEILTSEIHHDIYSPAYFCDDTTIILHDWDNVYFVSRSGTIRQTISFKTIDNVGLDMLSCEMLLTNKKKFLIFNAPYLSDDIIYDPIVSIFAYDINSNALKKITPPNISCTNLFLMNNNKLLFSGKESETGVWNIYEISIEGEGMKLLMKDAMNPSSKSN